MTVPKTIKEDKEEDDDWIFFRPFKNGFLNKAIIPMFPVPKSKPNKA